MKVVCLGGGAASFFFAAEITRRMPGIQCTILEQGKSVLGKVRISGGGRCNVTHDCPKPADLVRFYPRGGDRLLPVFQRFGPKETIRWFQQRGVKLKVEDDGRMFPVTDSSQTIVDCLVGQCKRNGVEARTSAKVKSIAKADSGFVVQLFDGEQIQADKVFVGTGSSKQIWQVLELMGHSLVPPVPSLFTFQVRDRRLAGLAGISLSNIAVTHTDSGVRTDGPFLITHKGLSGPAILKMSAFAARALAEVDYRFDIELDLLPDVDDKEIKGWRDTFGKKLLTNHGISSLPKRLHTRLVDEAGLDGNKKMATLSNKEIDTLTQAFKKVRLHVSGQNRFKEEFVTAGGVDLEEVDLTRFESLRIPSLFMAGEVLNIDAVTGGFNFQAAWSGAYVAAEGMSEG